MLSTAEFEVYSDFLRREYGVVVVDIHYEDRPNSNMRMYAVTVGIPQTMRAMRIKLVERYNQELDTERVLSKMVTEVEKWLRTEGVVPGEEIIPAVVDWEEASPAPISHRREEGSAVVPDFSDYIIAFREWCYDSKKHNLLPIGNGTHIWNGRHEIEARHEGADHAAPAPSSVCAHCGLFAKYDPILPCESRSMSGQRVAGAVACRGVIESHSSELRAQYMRPICLTYSPDVTVRLVDEDEIIERDRIRYSPGSLPPEESLRVPSHPSLEVKKGPVHKRSVLQKTSSGYRTAQRAAEQLGLPLVPFDKLLGFAAEHGQILASEWRGPKPVGNAELDT